MRLKMIAILLALLAALLPACSKSPTAAPSSPTPATQPLSIPGLEKPAAKETPGATTPTLASPTSEKKTPYPPPAGEKETAYPAPQQGDALLNERCNQCHDLARVKSAKKNAEEWKASVQRMVGKGARLTPEETDILVQYLAETFR